MIKKIKNIITKNSFYHFFYWKYRHLFFPKWTDNYLKDINHPHRKLLLHSLKTFNSPTNVLEIGCASGPNLFFLSPHFPQTHFYGLDISAAAVEKGKRFASSNNFPNISFDVSDLKNLSLFPDGFFDVVFSNATLIYFNDSKFSKLVPELKRISKKGFIFLEYDSSIDNLTPKQQEEINPYFIRDYHNFFTDYSVTKKKIDKKYWSGNWIKYGKLIIVRL